jgi:hypothetical protein
LPRNNSPIRKEERLTILLRDNVIAGHGEMAPLTVLGKRRPAATPRRIGNAYDISTG